MFTFCFTLAPTHQDGLIWAHICRGYSSGFSIACHVALASWFSHRVSRCLDAFYPDHLCSAQPCGLVSDYNPGWSQTRHSVSSFSIAFVDSCQPPSLLIPVTFTHSIATFHTHPQFNLSQNSPPLPTLRAVHLGPSGVALIHPSPFLHLPPTHCLFRSGPSI